MNGNRVTGTISAEREQQAVQLLSDRQLCPVQLDHLPEEFSRGSLFGRPVAAKHVCSFFSRLSDLLTSGVPLLHALQIVSRRTANPVVKSIVEDVVQNVSQGKRLSESLQAHPNVFSELMISMVQAGEEGGFLEDSLKRVADFTEQQEELTSRIWGAVAYPLFLLVTGGLIVVAMLVFFVPKFSPVFDRLSQADRLPLATSILLGLSDGVTQYGWVLLILLGLLLVVSLIYFRTEQGKLNLDQARLNFPGLGNIARSLAVARFCRFLGTLMQNGVPLLESLQIARSATGSPVLKAVIQDVGEKVTSGKSLAGPVADSRQFPEDVVEIIAVGEEANNLDYVLTNIADVLERRNWRQLETLIQFLEPVMLLVMAGLILFVVSGLLLPVLQSSGISL